MPREASAGETARSLYASHEKVYPREVHGRFARLRVAAVVVLLGAFYGVAWLPWGERQAVLFDLPARQFHLFGLTLFPQDFLYLAFLLIIAALSLFFFTALAGRLWCGYACPQTVWTELFVWIERQVEGNRSRQMKLDRAPWTPRKVLLKSLKHGLWLALSLWTGFTFVGYFTPIAELARSAISLDLGPWETFWVLFYGLATYGNAGWLREQVCMYMCPYARFQSAMFDADTLVISYDEARGETRGSRRRDADRGSLGLGDCIDCTLCVQVCPTGIDIRKGLQYQCIGCAACIDACDGVMERMAYPKGLIRYTTANSMDGKRVRVLRPRIVIYGLALLVLIAGVAVSVAGRASIEVDVMRDRNALYRTPAPGFVENVYTVRLLNKSNAALSLRLGLQSDTPMALTTRESALVVGPGEVLSIAASLTARREDLASRSTEVRFFVESTEAPHHRFVEDARFIGPEPGR